MVAYNSSYAYTTELLYYNGIIVVRIGPGCVVVVLTQPYQVTVTETSLDGEVSIVESQKYQVTVTEFLCTG